MKRLMNLLVVLMIAGMSLPAMAQEVDRTVLIFRTLSDPNVTPDPDVCNRGKAILGVPGFNLVIGASGWAVATRMDNGEVVNEKVRNIGTGTGCYLLTDPTMTPFQAETPMYFEAQTKDLHIAFAGECEATNNAWGPLIPPPENPEGPVFSSCYMKVVPAFSTPGVKWGQATGNSTFVPGELPGFETGSLWAIELVWE